VIRYSYKAEIEGQYISVRPSLLLNRYVRILQTLRWFPPSFASYLRYITQMSGRDIRAAYLIQNSIENSEQLHKTHLFGGMKSIGILYSANPGYLVPGLDARTGSWRQ
jgi:hypothetical protein